MALKHLTYTSTGRTFDVTDKEGKPTGQKTYKGGIGQVNVLDGKDYKPYVWDSEHQICKYNNYEIRLVTNGIEIYEGTTKLIGLGAHPEIEKELVASEFERKEATISGLATRLITNEDSADRIEISYDVETDDLTSNITFEVGGKRKVVFGSELSAKVLDKKQRLTLEFDQKATLVKNDRITDRITDKQQYLFDDKKSYWTWDESENADHTVTLSADKTEVHLKEKVYSSLVAEKIKPDTWGPTTVTDAGDCEEEDDTTYLDNYDGGVHCGNDDGFIVDTGMQWTVTDADLPGATVNSGTEITAVIDSVTGTGCDALLQIVDDRSPGAWGSSNRPSQQTFHPDSIEWDEASTGSQDSPELSSLVQQRIDGDDSAAAFVSGDSIAFRWSDVSSGIGNWIGVVEGDFTLTIVYTAASGGISIPVAMHHLTKNIGV